MTQTELIAEARRRYPVGSILKDPSRNDSLPINISSDSFTHTGGDVYASTNQGNFYVYYKGQWAKVYSLKTFEEAAKRRDTLEMRGVYREKLKAKDDEITELKYKVQKLEEEKKRLLLQVSPTC